MPYLLDSDVVIDHLEEVPEVVELVEGLADQGITISMVTYMEVYQGILRSPSPDEAQAKFVAFLDAVPILPFSIEVARRCAQLREDLRRQEKQVRQRALDLVVAATALENDLELVTRNRDDFTDIPNLRLYQEN